MADTISISLLQHQPTPGATDLSLERLDKFAGQARSSGSSLLMVPEASMTGYNISTALRNRVAEPVDGELTNSVSQLCRKHQIAISYGFIERAGNAWYNSVLMLNQAGEPVSHYRKTHLWGDLDRTLFTPGDEFSPVVEFEGWKIGHLICYDVEFPETVRHLALQGAELVLVSTALMSPWSRVADMVVPTRAYESQVFIAYANYCGEENGINYVGHSCISGPDGDDLAKAGSDPVLLNATLDKKNIESERSALPYHRDRRPALYQQLNKID